MYCLQRMHLCVCFHELKQITVLCDLFCSMCKFWNVHVRACIRAFACMGGAYVQVCMCALVSELRW